MRVRVSRRSTAASVVAAVALAVAPSVSRAAAEAVAYPTHAITMVVPFAAGGPSDVIARIVADGMARALGQSVVIENVGGAGGTTGSARVAGAKPDGYTLLAGSMGSHVAAPALYKNLKYNSAVDFTPVALLADAPAVIVTRKDFPANNLREFVAYLRAHPATVSQGHGGVGASSHMACLLFNSEIGATVNVVSYRGSGPALNDIVAGQLDYLCDQTMGMAEQISAGSVKAMAVGAPQRLPSLAAVPTATEGGLPQFQLSIWSSIFAPKGTPKDIVAKLNAAADRALDDPDVRTRVAALGGRVVSKAERTPAYLADLVRKDTTRWDPILRKAMVGADAAGK